MSKSFDFKKEWPKTKKKLMALSQEALDLAKKGEEKLVHLSHEGKVRFDLGTVSLKKEQIFHKIGKEYVRSKFSKEKSSKMKKLLDELAKLEKQDKMLNSKIKKFKTRRKTSTTKKKRKL